MKVRPKRDHAATMRQSRFATLATYAFATLPTIPALLINIEQAHGKSTAWFVVAISFVMAAPAAAEASVRAGRSTDRWQSLIFAMVALVLTLANILNAVTNATNTSDLKSDHRKSQVAAAKAREGQVALGRTRRAALVQIAGETPPAALEADRAALISANSSRWQATDDCAAAKITAELSKQFCSQVGALDAKIAAAKERDKIDAQMSTITAQEIDAGAPPATLDPYAESFSAILGSFGVEISKEGKHAITASRDWLWALGIELLAAVGPMILLRLLSGRGAHVPAPAPTEAKQVRESKIERPMPTPIDDPVYAFIATNFERRRGAYMRADEPWQMWLAHCHENHASTGSQRSFGMAMKACFSWERNNNRPRYINVAPRGRAPRLAVVNS